MSKRWFSDLPKRLEELEGTCTAEQAVVQLVDRRLRVLEPLNPPVKLALVASACGIRPEFSIVKMEQDARLVIRDGSYYIQVNSTHDERRHRFSIAHEIAHKIIAETTDNTLMVKSRKGFSYFVSVQGDDKG
jgi:hypothetical protein